MTQFNADDYFERKAYEQGDFVKQKIADLQTASARKIAALHEAGNQSEIIQAARAEANKNSWVSRLDLDPDSFAGSAVNLVASLASGTAAVGGRIAAFPAHLLGADTWVGQEEIDAYNRYRNNQASPEDMALLNSTKSYLDESTQDGVMDYGRERKQETVLARIERGRNARETAAAVKDRFDVSKIKHSGNMQAFEETLTEGFDQPWEQTKEGARALFKGNLAGAKDILEGASTLGGKVVDAVTKHPMAAVETAIENAPQLALGALGTGGRALMAVDNLSYGQDTYVEGMNNVAKKNGELPSLERQTEMQGKALLASALEHGGDMIQLGLAKAKPVTKAILKDVQHTADAVEDQARLGFKHAISRIGKATLGGMAEESVTEGLQTDLEGDITGKPASAREIFLGSVLGGLSGGILTGSGRTVSEVLGATEEHQKDRDQRIQSIDAQAKAIQTGDVSYFLDPSKVSYSPAKALAALYGNNQQPDTTAEQKQANREKADQILADLQARRDQAAEKVEGSTVAGMDRQIQRYTELLAQVDPQNTEVVDSVQEVLSALEAGKTHLLQLGENNKEGKVAVAELERLDGQLAAARQAHGHLMASTTDKAQVEADGAVLLASVDRTNPESVAAHQAASERVISLAMQSPHLLTPKAVSAIVDNTGNGLSAQQRQFLRTFSDARAAENALKTSGQVLSDIYFGNAKPNTIRYEGIKDYVARMGQALTTGNEVSALKTLQAMSKFAQNQANKAQLAESLIAQGKGRQILFNKATQQWEARHPNEGVLSDAKMRKLGGLTLNSESLVADIRTGADAIQKSLASLQAAYAMKFGKAAPSSAPAPRTTVESQSVQSTPVNSADSVEVTAAPSAEADSSTGSSLNQYKEVNSSVDTEKASTSATASKRSENAVKSPPAEKTEAATESTEVTSDSPVQSLEQEVKALRDSVHPSQQEQVTALVQAHQSLIEEQGEQNYLELDLVERFGEDYASPERLASPEHVRALTIFIQGAIDSALTNQTAEAEQEVHGTSEAVSEQQPGRAREEAPVDGGVVESDQAQDTTQDPVISLYAQPKVERPEGKSISDWFREMPSLLAAFTSLEKTKEGRKSERPLASVANFLSRWNKEGYAALPGVLAGASVETLNESEQRALASAQQTLSKWVGALAQQLQPARDVSPDFRMQDLFGEFFNADGTVDENVRTAMAYAAYHWVLTQSAQSGKLTERQINEMHGYDKDHVVGPAAYATLAGVVGTMDATVAALGEAAVRAMGIRANATTPKNLMPLLHMAVGTRIFGLLTDLQIVDLASLPYSDVHADIQNQPRPTGGEKTGAIQYVVLGANGERAIQHIKEANTGSGNVVDRLFGAEESPRMAETQPRSYTQKHAKRTQQEITQLQHRAIHKDMQTPYRAIPGMLQMLSVLSDARVLEIAGYVDLSKTPVHAINLKSVEATNAGLQRELTLFQDMLTEDPFGQQGYFITIEAWNNFRAGMQQASLNPQGSKLHRAFFAHDNWTVALDLNNTEQMKTFLIGTAMNLGAVKTDQQKDVESLGLFLQKLSDQDSVSGATLEDRIQAVATALTGEATTDLAKAIETVRLALLDQTGETTFASEDLDRVVRVAKDGEKTISLQALVALAQYKEAVLTGQTQFQTTVLVGADGKTNGPMLTLLGLGAGGNVDSLLPVMGMGGFYAGDFEHFSDYYQHESSQDLYEFFGSKVATQADEYFTAQRLTDVKAAIEALTGPLLKDGKASKHARNLMKPAITVFNYGSALDKAISGITDKVVGAYYESVEKIALKARTDKEGAEKDRAALVQHINVLLQHSSVVTHPLAANASIESLLTKALTSTQEAALRAAFEASVGQIVKANMQKYLQVLIARRQTLTHTVNAAYDLYNEMYYAKKEAHMQALMDSGELPFRITKKGERVPLHDLSAQQENQIRESLQDLAPVVHTSASLAEGNLKAGLWLDKSEHAQTHSPLYAAVAPLGQSVFRAPGAALDADTGNLTGKRSQVLRTNGYTTQSTNPGASALAKEIQSTDSTIMHTAMNKVSGTLNVHDEGANSLLDIQTLAQHLNRATYDSLLRYSPARESFNLLERQVLALAKIDLQDRVALQSLMKVLDRFAAEKNAQIDRHNKRSDAKLAHLDGIAAYLDLLHTAFQSATEADTIRLGILSRLTHVDQYSWEGGQHVVSAQQRQDAADQLKALPVQFPAHLASAMEAVAARYQAAQALPEMATQPEWVRPIARKEKEEQASSRRTLTTTQELGLPGTAAPRIIEGLQAQLPDVAAAVAQGTSVVAAINQQDEEKSAQSQQTLIHAAERLGQELTNAYGQLNPVGERTLADSDPFWVDWFHGKESVTFKEVGKVLASRLKEGNNVSQFHHELLAQLFKVLPQDLEILHVSRTTPASRLLDPAMNNARGWYSTTASQEAIYLLGPDYVHSFLTDEVLLHEMTHAAVTRLIHGPQTPEVQAAIARLNALLAEAKTYVQANGLTQFNVAVASLDEFIAYGMTNQEFMRSVLNVIQVEDSRTKKAMSALRAFAQRLLSLLYRGKENIAKKSETGMFQLIVNVSDLMAAAKKDRGNIAATVTQAMAAPAASLPTTRTIFNTLSDGLVSSGFNAHLSNLLDEVVDGLQHPMHSRKEQIRQAAQTSPTDVLLQAAKDGVMPFASKSLGAGFRLSDKEAFLLEQVEASIQLALENNEGQTTFAYRELSKLFEEARAKLKPQDFLAGDWQTAPQSARDLAKAKHDFLFALERGTNNKLNHLSRFAALGLASEEVNTLLRFDTKAGRRPLNQLSIPEKIHEVFRRVMAWIGMRTTGAFPGQSAHEKLNVLAKQLVQIEAKFQRDELDLEGKLLGSLESAADRALDAAKTTAKSLMQTGPVQAAGNAYVKAGVALATASANGHLGVVITKATEMRNAFNQAHQDLLTQTINEIRGESDITKPFLATLRLNKRREQQREELESLGGQGALTAFINEGKDLTDEDRVALGNALLRTNAQALINHFDLPQVYTLLSDASARQGAIQRLEKQLGQFKGNRGFYRKQARLLAYYMATGETAGEHLLKSSYAIAHLAGTAKVGTVSPAEAKQAHALLSQLVSLWAMEYSSPAQMRRMAHLLATEQTRGAANGVEFLLKYHQRLQKEAEQTLFQSPMLMLEGYVPEIYNPHTDVRVADAQEGAILERQGFVKGTQVGYDSLDPDQSPRHFYTMRGAGMSPWLTTSISFIGAHAKGSRSATDSVKNHDEWRDNRTNLQAMNQRKQANQGRWFQDDPGFDPRKVNRTFAAPVLDDNGQVTDYHYLMTSATKDSLLERDNRFDRLLGRLEASQFDKKTTPEQNRTVIQALHDQFQADYMFNPGMYREISPNSPIKEHRDLYSMLPQVTKEAIASVFGAEQPLMVRVDVLDHVFGYRKYNLGDAFTKEEALRSTYEQVFVDLMEKILGPKAGVRVRKVDDTWQYFVKKTKDIYVIKNVTTMLNNIKSNISELLWFGVPVKDIVHHHRVALSGVLAYRQDHEKLMRLKSQIAANYFPEDRAEMEREVLRLEDALDRNPVTPLILAGMMPTIVEDVGADDPYEYKPFAQESVDKVLKKVNPKVLELGKHIYMTHDTPLYKVLHYSTQVSDFVARYTLYQHLTTRKDKRETPEQALSTISEAFINYDILSHRLLREMNDRGLVWFTSYYLRIQKVLARLFHEKPGRAMGMVMADQYLKNSSLVLDASVVHRMGNNPFSIGALKFPSALDELAPVKGMLSLF